MAPFSVFKPPEGLNVQSHASASSSENRNEEHMEESPQGGAFREGEVEKPEDLVRELMQQEHAKTQQELQLQQRVIGEPHSYNLEEEDDEELEEDEKTAYEIAFQSTANRGAGNGHAEPSFLTMVQ